MKESSIPPDDIREIRRELGWTQQELAYALGTAVSTVAQWEAGKKKPRPRVSTHIRELGQTAITRRNTIRRMDATPTDG